MKKKNNKYFIYVLLIWLTYFFINGKFKSWILMIIFVALVLSFIKDFKDDKKTKQNEKEQEK